MKKVKRLRMIFCLALCMTMVLGVATPAFAAGKYDDIVVVFKENEKTSVESYYEAWLRREKTLVMDENDAILGMTYNSCDEPVFTYHFPKVLYIGEGYYSITVEAEDAVIKEVSCYYPYKNKRINIYGDYDDDPNVMSTTEPVDYMKMEDYYAYNSASHSKKKEKLWRWEQLHGNDNYLAHVEVEVQEPSPIKVIIQPNKKINKKTGKKSGKPSAILFAMLPWSESKNIASWKNQHKMTWKKWCKSIGLRSEKEMLKCYGEKSVDDISSRIFWNAYGVSNREEFDKKYKLHESGEGYVRISDGKLVTRPEYMDAEYMHDQLPKCYPDL